MKPVLLVIGGPNGSGKTTITTRLRTERYAELPEWVSDAVSDVPRDPEFVDLRTEAGILGS